MSRSNGRQTHETRSLQISFDGLARVDGSARFSFGPISALTSVSGPIEARLASENASQATLEVNVRPLSNVPATEAKSLAASLRALLTPSLILANNPRTLVQIVAQALVPSGSGSGSGSVKNANTNALTAALVNASTLALLNAGSIPMRGVVCAVAVGRKKDGALVVDPDGTDGELDGDGCFAFMFTRDGSDHQAQCVWTNWKQRSGDESVLKAARELAEGAAGHVYGAIHASVEDIGKVEPRLVLPPSKVSKEDAVMEDADEQDEQDDKMEI
ncbi:hypothetical protein H0H92_008457 [Tricholoma furcatifolium]|nr:hypothetical protein H0H92_008457 [Tricholoma furcatifolium]